MKKLLIYTLFLPIIISNCQEKSTIPANESSIMEQANKVDISREQYHDKVLGLLIGSAIGDAMGAPTEMWGRGDIQLD